jgi:23S rRNA (guanosine2251-2'-O)-methyltransferase
MIISGDNACLTCLIHNPSKVKEVLINRDKKANYMKIIEKNNTIKNVRFIEKKELQKIDKDNPRHSNDIIIRRDDYIPSSLQDLCNLNKKNSIIVALDQLTDQNNLGNIIRTCLLAGVNGIIISDHSSAPITSSTANTSAGAIEILKFHISKNLNRSLEELKKNGYWTYALDMKGKLITKDFRFDKKTILILGNEGKGIRKNIMNNSDFIISLPQEEVSGIDSYNAANSLAMTLFHYKVNLL